MNIGFKYIVAAMAVLLLSACVPDVAQNSYTYYGATPVYTQEGIIQDVQYNVAVNAPNTGTGAVVGAGGGAIIGSALGSGSSTGGVIGFLGGALIGGIVGNSIEQSAGQSVANLYIVRLQGQGQDGMMVSVVEQDAIPFCTGDHVYLIGNYQQAYLKLNDSYYVNNPRTGCFR